MTEKNKREWKMKINQMCKVMKEMIDLEKEDNEFTPRWNMLRRRHEQLIAEVDTLELIDMIETT